MSEIFKRFEDEKFIFENEVPAIFENEVPTLPRNLIVCILLTTTIIKCFITTA